MSTDDDLDEVADDDDPDLLKKLRKQIRDQAKALKEREDERAEAEQLRRERAFLRAGIDPDDPAARYFVKGYDGELDTDLIREAAIEARIIGAGNQEQVQAALAGNERATAAASGASPTTTTPPELELLRNPSAAKAHFKSAAEVAEFANRYFDVNDIHRFQADPPNSRRFTG